MNQIIKNRNFKSGYKTIICFLFAFLFFVLAVSSAYCIELNISPEISIKEGELKLEKLKMEIAGQFFGVDSKLILNYKKEGFRPEDIIASLYFSGDSKKSIEFIFILRKKEGDWIKVANKLGLPPNAHGMQMALTHGKGKKIGLKRKLAAEDGIFIIFISTYYGIKSDEILFYIEKGVTTNDILLALNLGANQGINFGLLLKDREKGLSWAEILKKRNISGKKLFLPYKSKAKCKNGPIIKGNKTHRSVKSIWTYRLLKYGFIPSG
jgi:hypothetical protein